MIRHVVLVGLVACSGAPDATLVPIEKCNVAVCGGNSPTIDHHGIHEINIDHLVGPEGFVLLGASKGRDFYDITVVDGVLTASGRTGVLARSDLVGLMLWLQHDTSQYGIRIGAVGTIAEVVAPYNDLETYLLEWNTVTDRPLKDVVLGSGVAEVPIVDHKATWTAVCPVVDPWNAFDDAEWDESFSMVPFDTLLFEGDRIDSAARTIAATPDDRWFNLGCARHTLAKLRLTRNTIHTVASRDWRQVQATIKMFAADYCGTGDAFTVDGEPIVWRNQVGMSYWSKPTELEARWDEHGALCLATPRLIARPSAGFTDVEDAIKAICTRQPCKNKDPNVTEFPNELVTSGDY